MSLDDYEIKKASKATAQTFRFLHTTTHLPPLPSFISSKKSRYITWAI